MESNATTKMNEQNATHMSLDDYYFNGTTNSKLEIDNGHWRTRSTVGRNRCAIKFGQHERSPLERHYNNK